MLKLFVLIIFFISPFCFAVGQESDTITKKKDNNIIKKVITYFDESNEEKEYKKFDFSVIGGPHYASDTKLGLGLVAAGLYRNNFADTLMPPSQISLYSDVSITGFYMIGTKGTHLFPNDKYRLGYDLYFYSFPSKYWGNGYDMAVNDENETEYDKRQVSIASDFLIRYGENMYVGLIASFDYISGHNVENQDVWNGQSMKTTNFGVGVTLQYDTRDNLTNAFNGTYVKLTQKFNPRFLGNNYAFSCTELMINHYRPIWTGAIIAGQMYSIFNYGNPPWGMMASLGGSYMMRGYYEGRYNDKCAISATIELRQHVWRRNGIVVWLGGGTIFEKPSKMRSKEILPNYGFGYRWEFKKRVNVRLDLGFGKSQTGFIFSINEAF